MRLLASSVLRVAFSSSALRLATISLLSASFCSAPVLASCSEESFIGLLRLAISSSRASVRLLNLMRRSSIWFSWSSLFVFSVFLSSSISPDMRSCFLNSFSRASSKKFCRLPCFAFSSSSSATLDARICSISTEALSASISSACVSCSATLDTRISFSASSSSFCVSSSATLDIRISSRSSNPLAVDSSPLIICCKFFSRLVDSSTTLESQSSSFCFWTLIFSSCCFISKKSSGGMSVSMVIESSSRLVSSSLMRSCNSVSRLVDSSMFHSRFVSKAAICS
mmetsp:Transcript_10135/g.25375  ORF Transcript_10135/g.25375 Transcript_10135/m.25375 type:complete len:282 (+) Transcript_10135:2863-3708(+)